MIYSNEFVFYSPHTIQLIIAQHPLVQFLLHSVKEVGAAFVLPAFDVGVETVAVLRLNPEYPCKGAGQGCLSGILPLLMQPISSMP